MKYQEIYGQELRDDKDLSSGGFLVLKKGEGRLLKRGGAWVFDNEIQEVSSEVEDGDIIAVRDFDGFPLGYGFYNGKSKIRLRLLSRREQKVTKELLYCRVQAALSYRLDLMGEEHSYRVIFGEADFLPGITVDRYEDILVVESLALGSDRLKDLLLADLIDLYAKEGVEIRGIYERSDAPVRKKEGLLPKKGFIGPSFDTKVQIDENSVKYIVDVENGQKTGFFLDQKENRRAIHRIARGRRVLDCFSHTGSFALNAAHAGASHVDAVDASELALAQARENAILNGLQDRVDFICQDAFEFLRQRVAEKLTYDLVILDPPAFTKSRNSIKQAAKGYREINIQGMKLTRDGGYFVTASCSHFMDPELFAKTIEQSARDAHVRLRQVEFRTQGPDHPILWTGEENSYYLKFYIFQLTREEK